MLRLALYGLPLLASLAACSGKSEDEDDDDTGGGLNVGGDEGGTTPGCDDPDAPCVTSAEVWCYHHLTGDEIIVWKVAADVTDPQGVETVSVFESNAVTVYEGSSPVSGFPQPLVCGEGSGICTGGWNEPQIPDLSCNDVASYTAEIVIADEDGNLSAPYVVTPYEGASKQDE